MFFFEMMDKNKKEIFTNLVQFELEKYCSNICNHPRVNHSSHYETLTAECACIHRAIHWHLMDKGLVCQVRNQKSNASKEGYENIWFLKKFDKKNFSSEVVEEYYDYFNAYIKNPEEVHFNINYSLDAFLRGKGLSQELDSSFELLNKKYPDSPDMVISEYNKSLFKKYVNINH